MTAVPHDHRPLWFGGRVVATCRQHFWLPLLNTGKPIVVKR